MIPNPVISGVQFSAEILTVSVFHPAETVTTVGLKKANTPTNAARR